MTPVSHGKPCAGNPHARFEEGASAPEKPRRNALLHSNKIELRACPFCGGRAARVRRIKLPTITAHTVRCECGASVANYDTRKAAIHAWNGGMLFKWKGARPGKCGKNAKKLIEKTHRELAAVKEGK